MVTVDDLRRLSDARKRIRHLREGLQSVRERRTSLAVNMDGMPHGSADRDAMAEYVAQIDELERALATELVRLEAFETRISGELDALPAQQAIVARLRYVENRSWKEISQETHYSEQHLRRIRDAAIKNLHK